MKTLLLPLLILMTIMTPKVAHADIGSSIFGRLWDSMVSTTKDRMESKAPLTVRIFQDAEDIFLGQTEDITTHSAVRDVYAGMRVAGLLLLGLCTVISLSQLTEAGLTGESSNIIDWFKRFLVATFMTMGSIHVYSLWIRVFNAMLAGFRGYLDLHWNGPKDPIPLYIQLVTGMTGEYVLLTIVFAVTTLIVLLILWFLIGGIRVAELAIAVIIAPLVWPVYLIPSLDDIPKSAFRSFLGLNATLIIIVGMLRLAMRMELSSGLANSIWNWVPSISMLILTIFLPTMIKKLVGQGHTGAGGLMTAAYLLAGLKGLKLVATKPPSDGAGALPPAAGAIPQAPTGESAYPVAPVSSGRHSGNGKGAPLEEYWHTAPLQLHAGAQAGRAALEAPYNPPASEVIMDVTESQPGSGQWDTVGPFMAFEKGRMRILEGPGDEPDDSK